MGNTIKSSCEHCDDGFHLQKQQAALEGFKGWDVCAERAKMQRGVAVERCCCHERLKLR